MDPRFAGLLILIALYLLWALGTRRINPLWLALGDDGRLSTSKFQFLLWTAVALYAYSALAFSWHGIPPVQFALPTYLLIAMGISLTTAVGAKAIAVSYAKNPSAGNAPGPDIRATLDLKYLICGDDNVPNLVKTQMLGWTIIAIGSYLYGLVWNYDALVACKFGTPPTCFPDIDPTLMVLMGLGHGAYIGNKLIPDLPAALYRAVATRNGGSGAGVTVRLYGSGLETANVTASGTPVSVSWFNGVGSFALPSQLDQSGAAIPISVSDAADVVGTATVTVP